MRDKASFEAFLDAYSNEFNEYLSSINTAVYSTSQHEKIIDELNAIYKKHPKVKEIIVSDKPHELSEEECTALIKASNLKNEFVNLEMQEVYFKGCSDCVGYIKRMKLL